MNLLIITIIINHRDQLSCASADSCKCVLTERETSVSDSQRAEFLSASIISSAVE